jgi:hypothetical protein
MESLASQSIARVSSIAAVEALDSTLLGVVPCILASCTASSLSSLAVVSATLGTRDGAVGFVLSFCLHCAKRLEQFLLELRSYSKELDKGLFGG